MVWVPSRILAAGWSMRVTEWADGGAALRGKAWELRHSSHVLCAAARPPDALATATDNGELIVWRLETGQPYARYRVDQPVHKCAASMPPGPRVSVQQGHICFEARADRDGS